MLEEVDQLFPTVPGLIFDMCMISFKLKTHSFLRVYYMLSKLPQNLNWYTLKLIALNPLHDVIELSLKCNFKKCNRKLILVVGYQSY